ncbi:transcription factor A, mitochondrial [Heterocephalus glaber]|uniref:Transcription factor A, mitochondrial n=1 Tax=Heterocephalus glaber TaxID=10181 RepID=A0A0N8ET49_HETGA|nr:transcription factor A, mitochondrial [Heterocephalus glaber]
MAFLRGVWGVLRTPGRSGAELCAGCGGRLRSPFSFVCVPKWFSSTLNGYPKKPVNSYIRFTREKMNILRAQYPELKVTELAKRLGEQWKELSDAEKKMYEDAYKEEWKAYREEVNRIHEVLTPAERKSLVESRAQRFFKGERVIKKKELLMLGKPKRARTAYNIFLSEYLPTCEGATIQAKWKSAHENWKNLSSSQKLVYEHLAKDDKIRYANEIRSWEERMIEDGRSDLVRPRPRQRNRMTQEKED